MGGTPACKSPLINGSRRGPGPRQHLRLVEQCDIVYGHIFPFSPRKGTPAARMPQVHPRTVRERAARLRAVCELRKEQWLHSLAGTQQKVLLEQDGVTGHAENFAPVRLADAGKAAVQSVPEPAGRERTGKIISAIITGLEQNRLIAQEAV